MFDFTGDPTLPAGWKIKKYKSKQETSRVHCEYLSPQNQVSRNNCLFWIEIIFWCSGVPLPQVSGWAHEKSWRIHRARHQDSGGWQHQVQAEERRLRSVWQHLQLDRVPGDSASRLEDERGVRWKWSASQDCLPVSWWQGLLEQISGAGGGDQEWS